MRFTTSLILVAGTTTLLGAGPDPDPIRGFTAASSKIERDWESKFQAIPDPARMRANMQRLSARPHHVGTAAGKANAEWLRDQFASYGWEAKIETFDVLFPTPIDRVVELVEPTKFKAALQEPAIAIDPTSNQQKEQLPTFNAYSID